MTSQRRQLVLSLFPGIDLLGRAFREVGYSVVTGPDPIVGSRIEEFSGVRDRFDGLIGGPPCQDFSCARRSSPPTGHGVAMLREFLRVVAECRPTWWLMENVPQVPDVRVAGYSMQRLDLSDAECGGPQLRRRHFQYGDRRGWILRPQRSHVLVRSRVPCVTASRDGRSYPTLCRLQGLDGPLALPAFTKPARKRAVGNGVSIRVGRVIARAVTQAGPRAPSTDCVCNCGRPVTPPATHAGPACRIRMERRRRGRRRVIQPGSVTQGGSA